MYHVDAVNDTESCVLIPQCTRDEFFICCIAWRRDARTWRSLTALEYIYDFVWPMATAEFNAHRPVLPGPFESQGTQYVHVCKQGRAACVLKLISLFDESVQGCEVIWFRFCYRTAGQFAASVTSALRPLQDPLGRRLPRAGIVVRQEGTRQRCPREVFAH